MLRHNGAYRVTDDPAALDREAVYAFLRESYWASDIPREVFERSLNGSLCFGLFHGSSQAGFCRVVTDRATFAYLADVFVLPGHRRKGLASWMVRCVREHPELQGLRRWLLATADAHGLYRKHGFLQLERPDAFMEIVTPYAPPQPGCDGPENADAAPATRPVR